MGVKINGIEYDGRNISIINGNVLIDGKDVTPNGKTINIIVDGNLDKLEVDSCDKILVNGNVDELNNTSGDVYVNEVRGNISTTSGDVKSKGNIGGSVGTTSGDVTANNINGFVKTASGDIKYVKNNLLSDNTTCSYRKIGDII